MTADVTAASVQTFTDSDGDAYSVRLSGPGSANVTLDDPDGDSTGPVATIALSGTNGTSGLTIAVAKAAAGNGRVNVGTISGDTLGSINAPLCDFNGTGISVRAVSLLRLGDLAAGANIILSAPVRVNPLRVLARDLGAMSLAAPSSTLTFTARSISGGAQISAAHIAAFNVTDGNCDARISTPGRLLSLSVKGGDFSGSITAETIGTMSFAKNLAGSGGSLRNAVVTARIIGTVLLAGDLVDSLILAGAKLGADGALGGTGANADEFAAGKVGTVRIAGGVVDSVVGAGLTPVDGKFHDGNDGTLGGNLSTLASFTVSGSIDAKSVVGAGALPQFVFVNRTKFRPNSDGHFVSRAYVVPKELLTVSLLTSTGITSKYTTIELAKDAAVSGDTIIVGPGTYNSNNLLKNRVNYQFLPGANIVFTGTSDAAIFDDAATDASGPVTCSIHGGSFSFAGARATRGIFTGGVARITNEGSNITFIGVEDMLDTDSTTSAFTTGFAAVVTHNGGALSIDARRIVGFGVSGVYWGGGQLSVNANLIQSERWGAVYGVSVANPTGDMHITAQQIFANDPDNGTGVSYNVDSGTAAKCWVRADEIQGGYAAISCEGGKLYVNAQKVTRTHVGLPGSDYAIYSTGGILWLDMLKLAGGGINCAAELHVTAQDLLDDLGATGCAVRVADRADATISVGRWKTTTLDGIHATGGTLRFSGILDASALSGGNPVNIESGAPKLIFNNAVLISNGARDSIESDSRMHTVYASGSGAKTDPDSHITISPSAGLAVDPAYANF